MSVSQRLRAALVLVAAAGTVASGALLPATAAEPVPGLPTVTSGARPGPDVLYAPPPRAPQLETTGVWSADPILVSGAAAYRDGEWLYQDYLQDDAGARGVPDPSSPYTGDYLYSPHAGTYTYPADPVFANNGADLVELRVKPLAGATAFRVTLNTLQAPERTAFTIALGSSPAAVAWPHGAGVRSPAAHFLTWHGSTAELRDAAGTVLTPAPQVAVDLERRQVEVQVPHAAWQPGSQSVRTSVGVGLWDPAAGSYLAPAVGPASATTPGGASALRPAIVNVGPRFDEPQPDIRGKGYSLGDGAVASAALATWWREYAQAQALTTGDVTPFAAEVDFGRLATRVRDDSGVPTSGPMNRILASRFSFGQGLDRTRVCTDVANGGLNGDVQCTGRVVGQLHPYAVYVPDRPAPANGFGLTLLMHSLSANYNQYSNSAYQRQVGERGSGSVVVTPSSRGPDGFYMGYPEADVFEVWADAARHYPLDPTWAASTGYSMGGFGTYRLMARYPDLFGRGFSVVGRPGTVDDQLKSLRNTPLLAWNGAADELITAPEAEQAHAGLVAAGVPHTYDLFATADHITLATNDEFGPGADFLGEVRADRDPPRISYVVDPREDNAAAGVVADHAYWLSGLRVRDTGLGTGEVEVLSAAFGQGVPGTAATTGAGALTGGAYVALPYLERGLAVGEPPAAEPADRLTVVARNVGRVVVDPTRARITCAADVDVDSDGPVEVVLDGCGRTVTGGSAAGRGAEGAGSVAAARALPATGPVALLPVLGLLLLGAAAWARRRG